jgi:hypothetical protein
MKIELKNIKFSEWVSEETNCFQATIYADGKRIGFASNDGHGGNTWCQHDLNMKEAFRAAEEYCKTLPPINYGRFEIDSNLENIVDKLFEEWLDKKKEKKKEKNYVKGICFGTKSYHELVVFLKDKKPATLAEILKTTAGVEHVKKFCEEKKARGFTIFNNNLPFTV